MGHAKGQSENMHFDDVLFSMTLTTFSLLLILSSLLFGASSAAGFTVSGLLVSRHICKLEARGDTASSEIGLSGVLASTLGMLELSDVLLRPELEARSSSNPVFVSPLPLSTITDALFFFPVSASPFPLVSLNLPFTGPVSSSFSRLAELWYILLSWRSNSRNSPLFFDNSSSNCSNLAWSSL